MVLSQRDSHSRFYYAQMMPMAQYQPNGFRDSNMSPMTGYPAFFPQNVPFNSYDFGKVSSQNVFNSWPTASPYGSHMPPLVIPSSHQYGQPLHPQMTSPTPSEPQSSYSPLSIGSVKDDLAFGLTGGQKSPAKSPMTSPDESFPYGKMEETQHQQYAELTVKSSESLWTPQGAQAYQPYTSAPMSASSYFNTNFAWMRNRCEAQDLQTTSSKKEINWLLTKR